jgi:valyl-tRNA synthetase
MDKAYSSASESSIYKLWEDSGVFTPKIDKTKIPYSVVLPLPNANDPMHMGHALFTIEDILVRYHRMLGVPTLWLPGGDHAGIETQFVFEKKLAKEGKSRFDFDRNTLYKMIWDFVEANRDINMRQMKKLGFSMDWTRYHYSLEPQIVDNVLTVFKKLYQDGLVYRDEKIVNYCTFCGTAFSNLEVVHKTVASHLWYLKYGPVTVATTRPETMLGDTAIAVNPADTRYQKLIGTKIKLPLTDREIPVIGDESVDPKFGTGAVKVTPSHSPEDYELGKKYDLEFIRIFDYDGRSNTNVPDKYRGLFPNQVREMVVKDMESAGLLEKTENYSHEVGHCYRCGRPIEPMTAPQWYIKIDSLAAPAIAAAKTGKVKFFPIRFKKAFITWMENIRDWNISRQIVWGPRIPAWYNLDLNPQIKINFLTAPSKIISGTFIELKDKYDFDQIISGLQSLIAPVDAKIYLSEADALRDGVHVLQETDTFDTWFLSGQWPLNILGFNPEDPSKSSPDFKYFYPTTVLDTLWDILFFWVARMIMFGLYLAKDVPFKTVHLHSRVVDSKGQKMSKSKSNVIDPLVMTEKYGTDALRFSLVYGIAPASDFVVSEDKIRAHRNFVNKIWNASRYILLQPSKIENNDLLKNDIDKSIIKRLNNIIESTTKNINNYHFGKASEELYQFFWHDFCDEYIESTKNRVEEAMPTLKRVLVTSLKLLHPFIPFVTETIYQDLVAKFNLEEPLLISSSWPSVINEKS